MHSLRCCSYLAKKSAKLLRKEFLAGVAEMGDAPDLGSGV